MLCLKCGAYVSDKDKFCLQCANPVPSANFTTLDRADRERHGFTSFWLISSLLLALIGAFIYVLNLTIFAEVATQNSTNVFHIINAIIQVAGCIWLLCWQKAGFWVYSGSCLLTPIINIAIGIIDIVVVSALVGLVLIAIMWGVLHLRKDGKTAWQQFEE